MHETSKPDLEISSLIEQTQSARFALIERIFKDAIFFFSALFDYWDLSLEFSERIFFGAVKEFKHCLVI